MNSSGTLYVVATPIGNLSDISKRVSDTLALVDLIAAEDTRRSLKLLNHLGLHKKMIRCDEAEEEYATTQIQKALSNGQNVALLSDAGTPAISDPGSRLTKSLAEMGFTITPISGPSAVTTLLSIAGFKAVPFTFFGFLPKKGGERKEMISQIAHGPNASVFFEAPFRLIKTVEEIATLSPNRMAVVGKEITKIHETFFRGTLQEIAKRLTQQKVLGEYTVAVAPLEKKEIKRLRRKTREEE